MHFSKNKRCKNCTMWLKGVCRLNPPVYVEGSWVQPQTKPDDACSHFHKKHGNVADLDGPTPHQTVLDFISAAKEYSGLLGAEFHVSGAGSLTGLLNVIYQMGSLHEQNTIEEIIAMRAPKWTAVDGVGVRRFAQVQSLFHKVLELMEVAG